MENYGTMMEDVRHVMVFSSSTGFKGSIKPGKLGVPLAQPV